MHQLRGALPAVALALLAVPAAGQEGEEPPPSDLHQGLQGQAGTGYWAFRLGVFDRGDDGDGNPFLDESLTVVEPIVIFDKNVTDRFGMSVMLAYDWVSSASIERLSNFDAQSGASGDFYAGIDLGFRFKPIDEREYGLGVHFSKEYDYASVGLGGSLTQEMADGDASIKGSLNTYFDTVDVIRYDGESEGDDNRTTVSGTVSWYQVMSPRTHGELGLSLTAQSGFLETPYNAVVIEDDTLPPNPNLDNRARGFEITEELPDNRLRASLFGKVRRSMGDGQALQLGGRLYQDDWGITAVSISPRWIQRLGERSRIELLYRYYVQSEADAYQESFVTIEDERTQDSDLADFDSHLFGVHTFWQTGAASSWDFGVNYLIREDGLDHVFGTFGWKWSF